MKLDSFVSVTKALADSHRVRMLMALRDGELCVCQLITLAKLAPSTVSKHMAVLKQAGLVASRKEGKWIYFRLVKTTSKSYARQCIDFVAQQLKGDHTIAADKNALIPICAADPESLCRQRRAAARRKS